MPVPDIQSSESRLATMNSEEDARVRQQREKRKRKKRAMRKAPFVIAFILTAVAGLLGGYAIDAFLIDPIRPQEPIKSTLLPEELDTVVGTYTFENKVYSITARDAIEGSIRLESRLNQDGTYDSPTADMVLSFARNKILSALADGAGATVTEEEVLAYASEYFGSNDIDFLAQSYDMDRAQAWGLLEEAARVAKLREYVLGSSDVLAAPPLPSDGNTEVANEQYGQYIIGLLGNLWDSASGTWANTDNEYYAVLSDMVFGGGLANYEAASAAYAIASEGRVEQSATDSERWTEYVNRYLDQAAVTIATLRA